MNSNVRGTSLQMPTNNSEQIRTIGSIFYLVKVLTIIQYRNSYEYLVKARAGLPFLMTPFIRNPVTLRIILSVSCERQTTASIMIVLVCS